MCTQTHVADGGEFKPISGQGFNSAIESAAVLATELINALKALPDKTYPSDDQITTALQRTQDRRRERLVQIVDAGHNHQSLMAVETARLEFVVTHIVPLGGMEGTFERFATAYSPRSVYQRCPCPSGSISKATTAAVFATLLMLVKKTMMRDPVPIPSGPLAPPTAYTNIPFVDAIPTTTMPPFAVDALTSPSPAAHCVQSAYLTAIFSTIPHLGPSSPTAPPTHHFDFAVT
ncbi:hypothetical protein SLS55_010287 [Diplodia seriata]|uniref:Uncharacterized protein n=1 Tax=Diplodia seriata TaxID=420778 RepID=A0ABR3C190_9PEZI